MIVSGGFHPIIWVVFVRVWNECAKKSLKKMLEIKHHFEPHQTSPPPKREASSCSQTQPCWRHVFFTSRLTHAFQEIFVKLDHFSQVKKGEKTILEKTHHQTCWALLVGQQFSANSPVLLLPLCLFFSPRLLGQMIRSEGVQFFQGGKTRVILEFRCGWRHVKNQGLKPKI